MSTAERLMQPCIFHDSSVPACAHAPNFGLALDCTPLPPYSIKSHYLPSHHGWCCKTLPCLRISFFIFLPVYSCDPPQPFLSSAANMVLCHPTDLNSLKARVLTVGLLYLCAFASASLFPASRLAKTLLPSLPCSLSSVSPFLTLLSEFCYPLCK
jgi:hypothetical protein